MHTHTKIISNQTKGILRKNVKLCDLDPVERRSESFQVCSKKQIINKITQ